MFTSLNTHKDEPENKTTVSLKTETYKRGNSYVCAKLLTTLKRKSTCCI